MAGVSMSPDVTLTASSSEARLGGVPRVLAICWVYPSTGGALTPLAARALAVGRDATCDVVLPGREVSRRHAEIRPEGPLFIARDLDSRNGIFVNGLRRREAPLSPGDVVRIGDALGVVVPVLPDAEVRTPVISDLAPGLHAGPLLRAAVEPALAAAGSDLPIAIDGETGTGKEVVARIVHERSGRRGPFLALNCAALPAALAEAELFGVSRGAFTGADRARRGHFRAADHGTLFLDEVGDLPLEVQAKLLRVLEQREVLPVGESTPVEVDVRVVVAGQDPLAALVARGRFRRDLFARLNGVPVSLPPLRARREEIPSLFLRLLAADGRPAPRVGVLALERLCLYDWPLNVRELVTLVRRLLITRPGLPAVDPADLPEPTAAEPRVIIPEPVAEDQDDETLRELLAALRGCHGNVAEAATRIGISRPKAYRLMKTARVDWAAFRG